MDNYAPWGNFREITVNWRGGAKLLIVAAMFVSSRGLQNVAQDPNHRFSALPCALAISISKITQTPVTYQEILLAVDLPVDVIKRFSSQPPP